MVGAEEQRDQKRERTDKLTPDNSKETLEDSVLTIDETDNLGTNSPSTSMTTITSKDEDFVKRMIMALSNETVNNLLHEPTNKLFEAMNMKVKKMGEKVAENKTSIDSNTQAIEQLKRQVDEYQQIDRACNII